MASTISKESMIPDIWKNFYDIAKTVTTVSITGPQIITIQNYVSSFPDQLIDSKSDYPILVVNDPDAPTEILTIGKTKVNGSIELEIYTTSGESASKFLSKIIYAIETSAKSLAEVGIKNIEVADTSQDSVKRSFKLHSRSVTFDFTYHYARTGGF